MESACVEAGAKMFVGLIKKDACLSCFLVWEEIWTTYSVGTTKKAKSTRDCSSCALPVGCVNATDVAPDRVRSPIAKAWDLFGRSALNIFGLSRPTELSLRRSSIV